MPRLENEVGVRKITDHLEEDIGENGIFVQDRIMEGLSYYVLLNSQNHFDESKPYTRISFRFENQIELYIPENLANREGFTNIGNLLEGAKLLMELQKWAEEHGELTKRSDSQGIWKGPHASKKYDGYNRPDGTISRIYLVHPEIYKTKP